MDERERELAKALIAAVDNDNQQELCRLLNTEQQTEAFEQHFFSTLRHAVINHKLDIVAVLINLYSPQTLKDIYSAVLENNKKEVCRIVETGLDKRWFYGFGLYMAATIGNVTFARRFSKAEGTTNNEKRSELWRDAALNIAARRGHIEVVQTMLNELRQRDYCYIGSALIEASCAGREEIVRLLLSVGNESSWNSLEYAVAFQFAAKQEHLDIARLLISGTTKHYRKKLFHEALLEGNQNAIDILTSPPRIRNLPKEEQEPFKKWLFGATRPCIDGIPREEQDGYFHDDYERWKLGLPNID
jgi:ankyrin repeat protein